MENDKIIYSISLEDIQTVTEESFERKPTQQEIKFVEDRIGDNIPWFSIIEDLLNEYQLERKKIISDKKKKL